MGCLDRGSAQSREAAQYAWCEWADGGVAPVEDYATGRCAGSVEHAKISCSTRWGLIWLAGPGERNSPRPGTCVSDRQVAGEQVAQVEHRRDQAEDRLFGLGGHGLVVKRPGSVAAARIAEPGVGCGAVDVVAQALGLERGVVREAGQVVDLGIADAGHAADAFRRGRRAVAAVAGGFGCGHDRVLLFLSRDGDRAQALPVLRSGTKRRPGVAMLDRAPLRRP